MNRRITVLCPYGLDKGLLSKAVELTNIVDVRVVIPKSDIEDAMEYGAVYLHTAEKFPDDEYKLSLWLYDKIRYWRTNIILAPATVQMRNIMPILAWRLKAGLTADCTELSYNARGFIQTRPAFGNSLIANIKSTSQIQLATVRPGTFPAVPKRYYAHVIIEENMRELCDSVNIVTTPTEAKPLNQSKIIIAGGLGIGSKEGFAKLESVAKRIGGTIAASRSAVDAGFAPYRLQVGMTGISVCPKIYIAVGISGAVQHLAGISGSDKIIAINSDPKAPIFDYADYGIVGDWETVIDKLLEELS